MSGTSRGWRGAQAVSSPSLVPDEFLIRPLSDLVIALREREVRGDPSVRITDVVHRSSDAGPGSVFFCVPGSKVDGHGFAREAVARGASALVVERWVDAEATQVRVPSVREAMGPMSAEFFGRPADRMTMVGITGTNGKTTTTYLLESVFRAAGMVPGVMGTTGVRIDGTPAPFPRTTPEATDFHRLLAEMEGGGVEAVAMEVSSHGLHQHRVDGARYACAVFTNLSQDHLDYHESMQDYFEAKARLFMPAMADRAVLNADSPEGRRLRRPDMPAITFGLEAEADVRGTEVETTTDGIAFRVEGLMVRSALRGLFNVENCLATMAVARSLGIADETAARGIAQVRGVPGRVEAVEAGQDFLVMVDYAHTPDGLENVLRAARRLATGRLIVVFGCGGDRDHLKRPLMGRVATSNSDLAVVTSDNPRSEDPRAIIAEVEPGALEGGGEYRIEPDRRTAIRVAVTQAGDGDVVVIAGKGHETGQEFADHTIPFDDREVAFEELRILGGSS
jgi:UDP-N-acetylmuramoyl-L-alanyl-D-glutamate--2,6-diaminopimelate ligase